jgi:hypothetical protein
VLVDVRPGRADPFLAFVNDGGRLAIVQRHPLPLYVPLPNGALELNCIGERGARMARSPCRVARSGDLLSRQNKFSRRQALKAHRIDNGSEFRTTWLAAHDAESQCGLQHCDCHPGLSDLARSGRRSRRRPSLKPARDITAVAIVDQAFANLGSHQADINVVGQAG